MSDQSRSAQFLSLLFGGRADAAIRLLESSADAPWSPESAALLRLAIQAPHPASLPYQSLHNLWCRLGRPALKPNVTRKSVALVSDATTNQFKPLLTIILAARGIHLDDLVTTDFDSVEQSILNPASRLYETKSDVVLLMLSEHWLGRYIGRNALVNAPDVARTKGMLRRLLSTLAERTEGTVLVGTFPASTAALPGGALRFSDRLGWNAARADLNQWLSLEPVPGVVVVDVDDAIADGGGRSGVGLLSYTRARLPYEPPGLVAVAREYASAIANIFGKSVRVIVSDWDNTLWGGEIGEAGAHGIVCGPESPDGVGYQLVQQYLAGLRPLGVLLAGVTRNDPRCRDLLASRTDLPLTLDDFASVQIGFGAKSESIARVSVELGIGVEHMLMLDDSLFEIAEVLERHPTIDVLLAGPSPDATVRRLSSSRLFNVVALSEADLHRAGRARALREQRDLAAASAGLDDFLAQIQMQLRIAPLTDETMARVVQLFQKTNQFNLTSRRHSEADLRRLVSAGATIGVISYEDAFGPQGIISAVIMIDTGDSMRIDSWIMSCRVLNRTVEDATFAWMLERAGDRPLIGEYQPNDKNHLVSHLYARLGFVPDESAGAPGLWRLDRAPRPGDVTHHIHLFVEAFS